MTNKICAICLDDKSPIPLVTTPCNHELHILCLNEMRKYKLKMCPLCRTYIPFRDWEIMITKEIKRSDTVLDELRKNYL